MTNILKIAYFEIKRLQYLWIIAAIVYLLATIYTTNNNIQSLMEQNPTFTPEVLITSVNAGLSIGIVTMFISSLLVWYQDWYRQGRMVSRWLAGPFTRSQVYWGKFFSLIYFFALALVFIYLTSYLGHYLLSLILGSSYDKSASVHLIFQFSFWRNYFPENILLALLKIGAWISLIPLSFLLSLAERAYSWKGWILTAVCYIIFAYSLSQLVHWGIMPSHIRLDSFYYCLIIILGMVCAYLGSQHLTKKLHI